MSPSMLSPTVPPITAGPEADYDPLSPPSPSEDPSVSLSATEINILIYLYLLESNFTHTAFSLLSESNLPSTSLFQHFNPTYPTKKPNSNGKYGSPAGRIERGALVDKLWKAVRWEEVQRHLAPGADAFQPRCPVPFHLILPHICPPGYPSSKQNPPSIPSSVRLSPPPAHRPEAFPPWPRAAPSISVDAVSDAPDSVAGPSRPKRRTRQNSIDSASEQQSRKSRSGTPFKRATTAGEKKRRAPGHKKTPVPRSDIWVKDSDLAVFSEHREAINCVAWNPKNLDVLITTSSDTTARIWDFSPGAGNTPRRLTNAEPPQIVEHKAIDRAHKGVSSATWHPDGTEFATAQGLVGRCFTPSGQLLGSMTYGEGLIRSVKFSPQGVSILYARGATIVVFALQHDGRPIMKRNYSQSQQVNDIDWLDEDVFASGGNDHAVLIYRVGETRPRWTFRGHEDDVTKVKWAPAAGGNDSVDSKPVPGQADPRSRLLASVSDDGNLIVWKLPSYPTQSNAGSRSASPVKANVTDDDYFVQQAVSASSEHIVHKLVVVDDGIENRRMSTLEWCRTSAGRLLVAA